MKISVTGTFSVPRKEVERKISEMGHEVVDFSGKTEILLVGEKTASPKKIAKAESVGIKIVREVEAEKILTQLFGLKYRDHYEREGKLTTAGIEQVVDVYHDFCGLNSDAGEWFQEDILAWLKIKGEEFRETLLEWLNNPESPEDGLSVLIQPGKEEVFLKAFRRLLIVNYVAQESEYVHFDASGYKITSKELSDLSDNEFNSKTLNLDFLEVYSTDSDRTTEMMKREVMEALKENDLLEKIKEVVGKG